MASNQCLLKIVSPPWDLPFAREIPNQSIYYTYVVHQSFLSKEIGVSHIICHFFVPASARLSKLKCIDAIVIWLVGTLGH